MLDADQCAFVLRVLRIYDDADMHDSLFWRVDMGGQPGLALFAPCNDVFWWATSDAEEITPANLPILEQAFADLKALEETQQDTSALLHLSRLLPREHARCVRNGPTTRP